MFDFIRYRKWFYVFSLVLVLLSLLSVFAWGLNWGIDFRGGSSLYVEYEESVPSIVELRNEIEVMGFGSVEIRTVGETGVMIQTVGHINESLRSEIMEILGRGGNLREGSYEFETISAMISQELTGKTRQAAILSLLVILLYVSWAFRKIYRPIPSWQYGLAALVALFFDLLIMLGMFVVLGRFAGAEINIPIITALLIVFGYSVNDSVVVFDRIRENLLKGVGRDYLETVNYSLNQSLARSVKTSLTTLIVLLFLLLLGGTTLYFFSLALIMGIVSGTYSSLFIASPLLVDAYQHQLKSKK